jgi:hypothetical protein
MRSKQALLWTIALTGMALVASTLAQEAGRPRGLDGNDRRSADSLPLLPIDRNGAVGADMRSAGDTNLGTADPALAQLGGEEANLGRQVQSLGRQLEAADSDTRRDEIKAKLGEALGKQFDVRQKRHGLEIEALEARIKKLKQVVQKRQENRAEMISRRLDQIVRDSQGLGF